MSLGISQPAANEIRRPRFPRQTVTDILELAAVLAAAAPLFFLLVRNYLRADFWFDELLSLERFILVPPVVTVTDYSAPNNHVFFNLLMNLLLRALGIRELFSLMDQPWVLRGVQLAWCAGTLLLLYAIGRRHLDRFTGACAAVILATTVPFYNFAVQVRGYSLSIMLLSALLYLAWGLEERPTAVRALGVVAAAALLLYTIPVNLYALLALALCEAVFGAVRLLGQRGAPAAAARSWLGPAAVVACVAGGAAVAVLLYLPILGQVLHNPFVTPSIEMRPGILTRTMPEVWSFLVSGRWLLLAAIPPALAAFFFPRMAKRDPGVVEKYLLLCAMLVLPFVFSFLRRDRVYDRIFVNLAPVGALFLALNVRAASRLLSRGSRVLAVCLLSILWGYCTARFVGELERKDRFLVQRIMNPTFAHREQSLYHNYFQTRYRPGESARLAKEFLARTRNPLPVILPRELYKGDFPRHFLLKEGVSFQDLVREGDGSIPAFDEALMITTQPSAFEGMMRRQRPGVQCLRLNAQVAYTNVYYCRE